jgi:hypothetical protein
MTNAEKFKTASERKIAYSQYCDNCAENNERVFCALDWLDAEYVVKLKPWPFCGSSASLLSGTEDHEIVCSNDECVAALVARSFSSPEEAIAAWNRRVK